MTLFVVCQAKIETWARQSEGMKIEPIVNCFCIWSDLLGFGRSFEAGGWSLTSEEVRATAKRVSAIENLIFQSNMPTQEYVLVLNDGIARNFDWRYPEPGYLIPWLHSALTNHWQINAREMQEGNPGMRSVLCAGQRMDLRQAVRTTVSQMLVSRDRAERWGQDISVYSPKQFQMNLAFSKAYLLESRGSKVGLAGPNFFVEDGFFVDLVSLCESGDISSPAGGWQYRNRFIESEGRPRFLVQGGIAGTKEVRLAIELDATAIEVNHRGINAKLHKVTRYQPFDEDEDFWFDFCRYEYQ